MLCLKCNKETLNIKFCSKSCSVSYNNLLCPKRKPKVRNCNICGKEFAIARRIRCDECKNSGILRVSKSFHKQKEIHYTPDFYKSLTIADYKERPSNKSKHPLWAHNNIRNFCRSWNKDLQNKPCQHCGYTLHVELCHIKPLAAFEDSATLGEVNHPNNIAVLCSNCHWEFDNRLFSI